MVVLPACTASHIGVPYSIQFATTTVVLSHDGSDDLVHVAVILRQMTYLIDRCTVRQEKLDDLIALFRNGEGEHGLVSCYHSDSLIRVCVGLKQAFDGAGVVSLNCDLQRRLAILKNLIHSAPKADQELSAVDVSIVACQSERCAVWKRTAMPMFLVNISMAASQNIFNHRNAAALDRQQQRRIV
eukprot:TRINITY_DN12371_c0_g1_i10.p3 TRINITY_DN12371_c0_g1~~TRINITY_DN12371_c0_g1_i10.p3  ORF type:complete len:185 (-),score=8.39 TRINITY_DN12371_c0_g1_i10:1489-2043(-)